MQYDVKTPNEYIIVVCVPTLYCSIGLLKNITGIQKPNQIWEKVVFVLKKQIKSH